MMTPPCIVCGRPGSYRVRLQRYPTGQVFSGYPLCWRHVQALETCIRNDIAELKANEAVEKGLAV